jgi:hypothetical protein
VARSRRAARTDLPRAVALDWLRQPRLVSQATLRRLALSTLDAHVIVATLATAAAGERDAIMRGVLRSGSWRLPAAADRIPSPLELSGILRLLLDDLQRRGARQWHNAAQRRIAGIAALAG